MKNPGKYVPEPSEKEGKREPEEKKGTGLRQSCASQTRWYLQISQVQITIRRQNQYHGFYKHPNPNRISVENENCDDNDADAFIVGSDGALAIAPTSPMWGKLGEGQQLMRKVWCASPRFSLLQLSFLPSFASISNSIN